MTKKAERLFNDFIDEISKSEDKNLVEAITKLYNWIPKCVPDNFDSDNDFYTVGDEDAPFFSETYLYILLGKEDARTLLSYMRPIWKLANMK